MLILLWFIIVIFATQKNDSMKKSKYFAGALALILSVSACGREKKEVSEEVNSRGIAMSVAKCIIGNQYSTDTLFSSPEQAFVYISNPDFTQNIIYDKDGIILNSPTVRIDSLAPSRYKIHNLLKSVDVDFSHPESVRSLKDAFPVYPEFTTVAMGDTSVTGQKAVFAYVVDDPSDKVPHSAKVKAWVERCIDDTLAFNENIQAIGSVLEKAFMGDYPEMESDLTYSYSRSLLAYFMSAEYVTYQDFFYVFRGGAHGMYGNRFVSYDLKRNTPVSYASLFKPGVEDQVRELIYEAIAEDDEFMNSHRLTSLSQLKSYFSEYLEGEPISIDDPGLLPAGVVFSYQPYEIAPYSDGNFFAVIPFEKLGELLKYDVTSK